MHGLEKSKKIEKIYISIMLFCFLGSVISMFFPYLEKLNVHSGDLSLPNSVPGKNHLLPYFALIFMLLTLLAKNEIVKLVYSFISLVFAYYTRSEIHFQGFIDHDYDSKSGTGYYMLTLFSVVLLLVTTVYVIRILFLKMKSKG